MGELYHFHQESLGPDEEAPVSGPVTKPQEALTARPRQACMRQLGKSLIVI